MATSLPKSDFATTWPPYPQLARTTGRALLDHIAERVWSSTWDIPDAVMPELLRRLAPRVEALVGDLDRPVEWETTFVLLASRLGARVDRTPGLR